jgi:acid stress-induced BolA-like protein IbaG/YrbA
MALQIINAGPSPEETIEKMRTAIAAALPEGSEIEITSGGPRHFEIKVVSSAFEGLNRVKQQQLVYGAITDLMAGHDAPVHAIDRLDCTSP